MSVMDVVGNRSQDSVLASTTPPTTTSVETSHPGNLEASAAVIIDELAPKHYQRPLLRNKSRSTSSSQRSTVRSSHHYHEPRWKLKYQDFLPRKETSSAGVNAPSETFQWVFPLNFLYLNI